MRGLSVRINKNQRKWYKKESTHRPETNQISVKNRWKIIRKSIINQPKINRNHRWSETCRALRLGSCLGGVLEASWARLRVQHSTKLASQIEGKSIKNVYKNRSKTRCLPSCSFDTFFEIFGRKMEACWHQDRINNRCQLRKADFAKSNEKQLMFNEFSSFWGRSWHQKSINNLPKPEAQDGLPLGIDFWWILVGSRLIKVALISEG